MEQVPRTRLEMFQEPETGGFGKVRRFQEPGREPDVLGSGIGVPGKLVVFEGKGLQQVL